MKKLLPPILFIISIKLMLFLHFFIPITSLILFPFNLLGILFLVLGLLISISGSRKFKKVGTTIMTFDNPEKLVIDGLYKFTRNPMYLGFLIFLIGFFIILGTLTPVFIVFLFFIITDNWYIKFEELKLIDKFGENYLTYKKNVRKWL